MSRYLDDLDSNVINCSIFCPRRGNESSAERQKSAAGHVHVLHEVQHHHPPHSLQPAASLLCSIVSASGAVAAERCVSAVLEHRSALATLAGDLVLLPLSLLGLSTAANTVNKKIVYFRYQLNQDCLNIF